MVFRLVNEVQPSAPGSRFKLVSDGASQQIPEYQPGMAWNQQPYEFRSMYEQKAEEELASQFSKEAPFDIARSIYGRPTVNSQREPITAEAVSKRAEEMARENNFKPGFGGGSALDENKVTDRTIMNAGNPGMMFGSQGVWEPKTFALSGDELYDVSPPKMGMGEAVAKGAVDMSMAVPGVKSMTAAAGRALGDEGANAAQMGQDWEAEATRALEDRPVSFRVGQGAALTAGGGAQLYTKGMQLAPKAVPASLAAKFAGEQAIDKGARYGGRLAAMSGLGAADYAAYNAIAEAPNIAREAGEPIDRMGTVARGLKDPLGYAPLPVASLIGRGAKGIATTTKNTLIGSVKAGKPQFIAGAVTPKSISQRVTIPQMTKGPGADERTQAINLLLKKGLTPEHIEEMVNLYHYNGKSTVNEALLQLANNPKVDQLTVALGTVGGDAQETMRKWFQQEIASSPSRLQADLRAATGLDGSDFYDAQKKLKARRTSEPGKLYDEAYGKEVSEETWGNQLLPAILDYDGAAESIAEAAARAAASGKPGTREAAAELYQLADEIAAIKKAAVDAGYPGGLVPAGGLAELGGKIGSDIVAPRKVSTQALDQLDRVLGDKAKGLTSGARPELAGTVLDTQTRIRGTGGSTGLDPETGLNAGRDLSAELKSAERALDFGRKAFKSGTDVETLLEEFAKEMRRYGIDGEPSNAIKGSLLLGWLKGAEDEVAKATNPGTVIRQLYGSERQRQKMIAMMPQLEEAAGAGAKGDQTKRVRALVGGKREDGRVMPSRFEREKDLLDWQNKTVGNSQSAQRLEAVAEQGGAARRIDQAIDFVDAPRRMLVKGAKAGVRRATLPAIYKPGVNRELGNILTTSGRKDLLKVADEMRIAQGAKRGGKPNNTLAIGAGKAPAANPKGPVRGAGWTGRRPTGYADELERGSDSFRDPRLNDNQNKIVEMAKNGYSNAEIAEEMAVSPQSIAVRLSQMRAKGIDIPVGKNKPKGAARLRMEKLINEGLSDQQVAARTGKTAQHVAVIRNKMKSTGELQPVRGAGWTGERPNGFKDDLPRGTERFHDERLTPTQNKAVEMARNGFSRAEIAEELMMSPNNVSVHLSNARKKGVDWPAARQGLEPSTSLDILRLAETGIKPSTIAERLGISRIHASVTLSRARKALRDAGEELPDWLKPDIGGARSAGLGDFATGLRHEATTAGVGAGLGAQGAQDLDGDGKVSGAERALFAAGGAALLTGGPRALAAAKNSGGKAARGVRGAGSKGRPELPMDEASRMARAKADGFDTDTVLYHGTDRDFKAFDQNAGTGARSGTGTWLTTSRENANSYAPRLHQKRGVGGQVYPVHIKKGNYVEVDASGANWSNLSDKVSISLPSIKKSAQSDLDLLAALGENVQGLSATQTMPAKTSTLGDVFGRMTFDESNFSTNDIAAWARKQGYDGVRFKNVKDRGGVGDAPEGIISDSVVIFDPKNIRSKFAKFDPDESNSPILSAGPTGRKPPKPRLGRTLESLINEPGPAARPADMGRSPRSDPAPAPQPEPPRRLSKEKPDPELEKLFSDLDGRTARNSANIPTGHYGKENNAGLAVISSLGLGLGAVGGTAAYMTAKPADPNFKGNRAKVLKQLAAAPDSATWQNRIRQMDEFIESNEARMTELEAAGVPRQLMNARRKAVREASDAFASATGREAVERAVARVEALDYAIDVTMGEGDPFKEAPTAPRPASLKNPVPAGINSKMVGRAAQMTGNALAMANDKATTGVEKSAEYIAERLRTAELPKRPIDLLMQSEIKRNRKGQFVRDMETKRKNDELWQRNGYTGYRGRKMTQEERRAYGKGAR